MTLLNVHIGPKEEPNVNRPGNHRQATLSRFQRAMNTGDAKTISKRIDQTEGGNR
jgi:hypothetical protein